MAVSSASPVTILISTPAYRNAEIASRTPYDITRTHEKKHNYKYLNPKPPYRERMRTLTYSWWIHDTDESDELKGIRFTTVGERQHPQSIAAP